MSQTVNGIKYYLSDDCDTLVCKLENSINEMYLDDTKYNETKIDNLESDLEKLQSAIEHNNRMSMQEILDKYHHCFKRYR